MSCTNARGILLQLTRLSPAVPRAFCLIMVASIPYVRNFCPQAHNSAARREKNRSQSDSCDPRCGIAGWRGSAPRQLQHLVENQLNRLKRAAQRYRLPRRGTKNRANRNGALLGCFGCPR